MEQERNSVMEIGVREKPTKGKWVVLSFQHVFAMFGATILVPLLVGLPVAVALFTSGVGTLIYILCTKAKVPVYLGSSFAYIAAIQSASIVYDGGVAVGQSFGGVMTALMVVGIVYVVIAMVVKLCGKGWLDKVLPPVVIGPAIMVIGFGLAGTAISNTGMINGNTEWAKIAVTFFTLILIAVVSLKGKGFLKVIPFIIGIVGGYLFALIIDLIGNFGLFNFTDLEHVAKNPELWVKIPDFMFIGWENAKTTIGHTNIIINKFDTAALLTIVPIALVTACEHIGDHAVLSKVVGQDFLTDPGLDKTLMGDGVATLFAACVGGPANTTYGENTSVVGMTKVASVWVTGLAAIIAIILSFLNIFAVAIATIPWCVISGMCLILYGFIGLNGARILFDNKVDLGNTRNLIIISVVLVIGLGGAAITIDKFSITSTALSAIVGILLNLFLPKSKENKETQE